VSFNLTLSGLCNRAGRQRFADSHDIRNEAFWQKLSTIFLETREMIAEWARAQASISLERSEEDETRYKAQTTTRRQSSVNESR
jgi:hypothetical protein